MCTVILGIDVVPDYPIFMASNRDEQLERPSVGPEIFTREQVNILAPRDLQEGGTWLGLNQFGVLTALTNRFGSTRNPDRFSRGDVVIQSLIRESASDAAAYVSGLQPDAYNPFHLITADHHAAHLIWSDGKDLHTEELGSGFHIITERSFEAAPTGREGLIRLRLDLMLASRNLGLTDFEALLAERIDGSMDGITVHMPEWGYGTRSSTIAGLGQQPLWRFADGSPDTTPYLPYDSLVASLIAQS